MFLFFTLVLRLTGKWTFDFFLTSNDGIFAKKKVDKKNRDSASVGWKRLRWIDCRVARVASCLSFEDMSEKHYLRFYWTYVAQRHSVGRLATRRTFWCIICPNCWQRCANNAEKPVLRARKASKFFLSSQLETFSTAQRRPLTELDPLSRTSTRPAL